MWIHVHVCWYIVWIMSVGNVISVSLIKWLVHRMLVGVTKVGCWDCKIILSINCSCSRSSLLRLSSNSHSLFHLSSSHSLNLFSDSVCISFITFSKTFFPLVFLLRLTATSMSPVIAQGHTCLSLIPTCSMQVTRHSFPFWWVSRCLYSPPLNSSPPLCFLLVFRSVIMLIELMLAHTVHF